MKFENLKFKKLFPSLGRVQSVITVENNYLRMLEVKGNRVVRWSSVALPTGMVQDGFVADSRQLEAALSGFVAQENLSKDSSICFPSNRGLFRTVLLPRMKRKLLAEAISREAKRELPLNIENLYLFSQVYAQTKDTQSVLVAAMQKEPYERLFGSVIGAGLQPKVWEIKPLALVRALGQANAVILDVHQTGADLMLVVNGAPELVRSLVIQAGLSNDERAAALAREIAQSVEFFNSNGSSSWNPETPLFVTGALASDADLLDSLRALSILPLKKFACPFEAPEAFPYETYAAAIGAMMKLTRTQNKKSATPINFSVLPEKYQKPPFPVKKFAAGGAIAAASLLLVPSYQVYASNNERLSDGHAALTRVQRQTTFARADLGKQSQLQKKVKDTLDAAAQFDTELGKVRAAQLQASQDITTAFAGLPSGVALSKFLVKADSVTFEGEAPDERTVLLYVRALEKTARFPQINIDSMGIVASGDGTVTSFVLSTDRKPSK